VANEPTVTLLEVTPGAVPGPPEGAPFEEFEHAAQRAPKRKAAARPEATTATDLRELRSDILPISSSFRTPDATPAVPPDVHASVGPDQL
jgi:hypothetical protein